MKLSKIPKLSFHPRLAAGLDLIVGGVMLWWISGNIHSAGVLFWWLIIRWAWWASVMPFVYYPESISRLAHFFTLVIFNLGLLGYLAIIDTTLAWLIFGTIFIVGSSVSFWLIPSGQAILSFTVKPQRRWRFLLCVSALAGIWSGVLAMPTFQIISYNWAFAPVIAGGLITTAVSIWWWGEYGLLFQKAMARAAVALFILMFEFGMVLIFWPIGYLTAGFFLTWLWYILWLMLRFRLSAEGINWKRQRFFLIANAVLIIIYLFIIRWR